MTSSSLGLNPYLPVLAVVLSTTICLLFLRGNIMSKPEAQKLLEETKQRLFESDEFVVSRNLIQGDQTNSCQPDDLDTLLDRIDRFAPAMRQGVDPFVDSASLSEGPDRALSTFNSSFPAGYFDSLFQEGGTDA